MFGIGLLLGVGLGCNSRGCHNQHHRCDRFNFRCVEFSGHDSCNFSHHRSGCGCGNNCSCGWDNQNCGFRSRHY